MEGGRNAPTEFVMEPSQVIKRKHNDVFKANVDGQDKLPSILPINTDCFRPPKKFASDIKFTSTQDLDFNHLDVEFKQACPDMDHERIQKEFSSNIFLSDLEHKKCTAVTSNSELEQNKLSFNDRRKMNDKKQPSPQTTNFELVSVNIQREEERRNQTGCQEGAPIAHNRTKHVQKSNNGTGTIQDGNSGSEMCLADKSSNSQIKCKPESTFLQHKTNSRIGPTSSPERTGNRESVVLNREVNLISNSPSSKAKLPQKPILQRTTKLAAIKENEVTSHYLDKNFENPEENSNEAGEAHSQDKTSNKAIGSKESGDPINRTSMIPFHQKNTSNNVVMDVEWEFCTQWLNNDRAKTLEKVKNHAELTQKTEASLCYELEQMLVSTKEILQSELEFSVRLCSLRGQCLISQEAMRLEFDGIS